MHFVIVAANIHTKTAVKNFVFSFSFLDWRSCGGAKRGKMTKKADKRDDRKEKERNLESELRCLRVSLLFSSILFWWFKVG